MCNFGPVRTTWGPTGGLCPKKNVVSICLRDLIEVLFCLIHDLDVQCASLAQSNCPGPRRGHILKFLLNILIEHVPVGYDFESSS